MFEFIFGGPEKGRLYRGLDTLLIGDVWARLSDLERLQVVVVVVR